MAVGDVLRIGLFVVMGGGFIAVLAFAAMGWLRGTPSWHLVNASGNRVGDGTFTDVGPFSNGLAPARTDRLWGYIGVDGAWAIEPRFAAAEPFDAAGYAQVHSTDTSLWGLIDTEGRWAMPPEYLAFSAVSPDGLVAVREGMGLNAQSGTPKVGAGLFDLRSQQWRVEPTGDDDRWMDAAGPVQQDRLVVQLSTGWQVVDASGAVVAGPWDRAWGPSSGRIRVQKNGTEGFVDLDGDVVVPLRYGLCTDMVDGVAAARTREGSVLIDAQGVQRGPVFTDLMTPAGGRVAAQDDSGAWGFVDTDGQWVLPPQWSAVGDEGFASGVARVGTDEGLTRTWQWIDRDGRPIGEAASKLSAFAEDRGFAQAR